MRPKATEPFFPQSKRCKNASSVSPFLRYLFFCENAFFFCFFLPCICERVLLHRLESFFSEAISFYSLMEGEGRGEKGFSKKGRRRSVEFCGSEGKPLFEMDAIAREGKRDVCYYDFLRRRRRPLQTHNDNLYPFQDHRNKNSPIQQHFTFPYYI